MSTGKANKNGPTKDPYEVLGIPFGATDTEIAKAYRTLARTLHPDKLVSQNLSPKEIDNAAVRFQEIQIARSFLLDAEHVEDRRKYDTKMASEQVRRVADKTRDMNMSERRKRMRDELKQYEEQQQVAAVSRTTATTTTKSQTTTTQEGDMKKRKLAREGMQMREKFAAKEEVIRQQERAKAVLALQNRQIRLKWSRKKLKAEHIPSPSEDSIAQMLSVSCGGHGGGIVEQVQMLGDKGNAALVTFAHATYCDVAVELYRTSELWRAVYVNKIKQEKEEEEERGNNTQLDPTTDSISKQRDQENVHEWKERQAREREELIRRMGDHDGDGDGDNNDDPMNNNNNNISSSSLPSTAILRFPLPFPKEEEENVVIDKFIIHRPLEILEQWEDQLLIGIVSDVILQQMKVIR